MVIKPSRVNNFPSMVVDYVRVNYIDNNPTKSGQIKEIGGRCLDVTNARTENQTPIQIYDCNGTSAQDWTLESDGTIKALGKCSWW